MAGDAPLRRRSKKNQAVIDEMAPIREAFALEHRTCMVPWCRKMGLEVHEIARGCHRGEAFKQRISWLLLCRKHHEEMGDYALWPIVRQFAVKAIADTEWYDRVELLALRGRAPTSIDEREVLGSVVELLTRPRIGG